MAEAVLLYVGSAIVFVWGAAHILATGPVVESFGSLSEDNQRIITMEWVAEGLALCFLGVLVALVGLVGEPGSPLRGAVLATSIAMVLVMTGWTFAIGGKTSILPIRVCPAVLSVVAGLWLAGLVL